MKAIPLLRCVLQLVLALLPVHSWSADLTGPHGVVWLKTLNKSLLDCDDTAHASVVDASGNIIVTGISKSTIDYSSDCYTAKYAGETGNLLWERRYNDPGNYNDEAHAVAVDSSGNVFVTGSSSKAAETSDYYTAKYAAATGALLWEKHYDGPGKGFDSANAIAVDSSGNAIVTGYSVNAAGNRDYYTAKYAAANGVLLWERRYNDPNNGTDIANAIAVDGSGNVIVTGASDNEFGRSDYYTAKYAAATGAVLWEKRENDGIGYSDNEAVAVTVDKNGNPIVTGSSPDLDGFFIYYTVKYSANGAKLWENRTYSTSLESNHASAIAVDSGGNAFVTGTSYDLNGYADYLTVKYAAATGAKLWEKHYNGTGNDADQASDITVDASGNVIVTGASTNASYDQDYLTVKYAAANGALLWEKRYNGAANDEATAIAVSSSGNVFVTGYSFNVAGDSDYYTAKYAAASGSLLWEERSNGLTEGFDSVAATTTDPRGNLIVIGHSLNSDGFGDGYTAKCSAVTGARLWTKSFKGARAGDAYTYARAVAVDSKGNVIVTGAAYNAQGQPDCYTAKYAATTGALLWEKYYTGPGNATANAISVDGNDDVIVTGSCSINDSYDYYTAKYTASTGALLWEARYNGPSDGGDEVRAIAVDSSDNAIVTGYSLGSTGTSDFLTVKYAGATGALLWKRAYNGTGNNLDEPRAIAVDASGNAIVTGYACALSGSFNYYTAKYAAATGALLWEKIYNGTGNGSDQACATAVDGSGNVIVTGFSTNANLGYDYYTAKYSATTGSLLWEKRYNGLGNGDDFARDLAVDASGNVVVSGDTKNAGGTFDLYTTAYAATNGALLWENRYNGSANADDRCGGVVLDKSANVFVAGWASMSEGREDYLAMKIIPVTATRVIGLSGNMAFGSVPAGSAKTSILTIRNTGNSPLTVSSITYPAGFSGSFAGTIQAGSSQGVTVTFKPTAVQNYTGTFTVNSNKTSGTNTLAVSGTGIAATRVIALSGSMVFGNVKVGSSKSLPLTIKNTGNSPLNVTSIAYSNGYSGTWAGTIPVGGSQVVTVTFKPTIAQVYNGTLTVNSNKTSGTSTVPVSGTGVR